MAERIMNLPPGFEIEEPGAMNLPAGFEIEREPPQMGGGNVGFGATIFGSKLPGQDQERKTVWEGIKDAWSQGGIRSARGLAGLIRAEVERETAFEKAVIPKEKRQSLFTEKEKIALKEWSIATAEAATLYYEENPEEAMQLDADAGFLATTWDVVSHPEKIIQGAVEAIPLMLEAALGTIIAGPVGGIAVMAQPIIGNTYQTAREEGTEPMSALMQATLTGYGEAAIEQWTFSKKLGIAKGISKILKGGGKRILWEGTKLYGRGMIEEGTQKFNANLWNLIFTDRSQMLTEGIVQAMAVGGPLEVVMGGAFAGIGAARGGLVPNSEKTRRIEALRNRVAESSIPDEGKAELYAEFEQTIQDVLAGKFDSGPVEIEATADAATQLDAAETVTKAEAEAIGDTQQLQGVEYEELLELAEQGDELAAYRIQEMTAEAALEEQLPTFEVLFGQMLEGDEVAKTAIQEGQYKGGRFRQTELEPPTEAKKAVLRKVYSKGFVAKLTSIRNNADNIVAGAGNKKAQVKVMKSDLAKVQEHYSSISEDIKNNPELLAELSGIEKLLPEYADAVNSFIKSPSKEGFGRIKTVSDKIAELSSKYGERLGEQTPADRGRTRVDSTIPASDEQARNFATIKIHALAKLLNMKGKDRQQIQFDLVGKKSLKKMSLEEVKEVQTYFVAQAKERGLSTSTGKELADSIKLNNTQIKVQSMSGIKPVAWKRMMEAPGKYLGYFLAQSKRIERLMEALDGFTEGPLYNSIWRVVLSQTVNSRVSGNERVAKFKEALTDIMTPELQTDGGIAAAAEFIAEEEAAAGKKARKLSKRAIRKLVGGSLWAKFMTGGREVVIEATAVDPELSLNPSERIGVYLAMKNEDSRLHLLAGNFAVFENPDLAALSVVEAMSSQERKIGDWILRDLESNFERANDAAKLGLGRDLEEQDNYFPIRILGADILQQKDFLSELEGKPARKIKKIEPGEVKERKRGATQALELDAFNVYLNHLTRIEQFIHMAPVAKSVGKILNTKEFRQAVNNVTAGHGAEILDRWLKDSIKGHSMELASGILTKTTLWSRKKGVLFFLTGNLPSVARQFISFFDGVATHPMTLVYAAQHMVKSIDPRYYKMLEKRMRELSPEINLRSFERYLANIKHQAQAAGILTGKEEWSQKALGWQRWSDRRTVVIIWNAFYDAAIHSEAVQKQFELDGSDETAITFANKMVGRTQPMGNVEHLPDFFRGGAIERLLSTFQNQINNRWNFWAHDIYGMRKAGKISRKMVMYRVLFIHILPAMMFGAISRGGLPKDWEDALFDQAIYVLGPLSLPGRIITDAMLGFAGGRTGVEDALTANVGKAVEAVIKKEPKKAVIPALKVIGGATGLIPNQIFKTGTGIRDIMTGETDDLRRLIYSEWSLTNYGWPETKAEKEAARKKTRFIQR